MDKKLKLEYIVGYLPYGLKVFHINWEETYIMDTTGDAPNYFHISDVIDYCKPLVRPLSDLTEEIEHNGEKFVPLTELQADGMWCDAYTEWWDFQYPDYERMMENCPHNILVKLYEWHFDIHSLIEKGLALNIYKEI